MIAWMTNNNNDITQMNLHMSSKDFKMYAESQNLKEKQNVLNRMREDYGRNVTDYQTKNILKISFFGGV